jgi:hypothetical protein
MSVRIMAAIFEHSSLPPMPRFVLLALADHADHDGYAWPAVERICHKTGLARSSVQRALGVAEEAGELIRTVGGGRSSTSLYRIILGVDNHPADGDKGPQSDTLSPRERAPHRAERAPESARKGPTVRPESSINHQEPRASSGSGNPHPPPPAPDPEEFTAGMADLKSRLAHPARRPPEPPALEVLEGDQ